MQHADVSHPTTKGQPNNWGRLRASQDHHAVWNVQVATPNNLRLHPKSLRFQTKNARFQTFLFVADHTRIYYEQLKPQSHFRFLPH